MKQLLSVSLPRLVVRRFVRWLLPNRPTRSRPVVYVLAIGSAPFFFSCLSSAQQASPSPSPTLVSVDVIQTIQPESPVETKADTITQNWAIHGDAIEIFQGQPGFHDPYNGPNSLHSDDDFRQTSTVDLFFDARLWPGAELYFNPEYFQGFGLGGTRGIAEFPNSEAYKVGKYRGDVFIPHLFIRQIFGFGGEQEHLDEGPLQLAENVDISRLTITVGKMAVGDQFDNNAYSHDASSQFLNWALVDAGAFDYAADSLGYEYGITAELNQRAWAARVGYFTVPRGE
jgi:high affinity Mn2+ porin